MEKGELQKFFMFFLQSSKKRGISTIVASVLIVLITVAGVAILWAGFYPLIQQVLFIEDVNVQVKIDRSEYTQYDSENELLSVRVSRGSDEADIVGIKFIVDDSGDTFSHISYDVVEPNSAKVYSFSTYDLNSVGEVSVVPIYNVNGVEKESQMINSLEKVPESNLSEVDRKFIGFGYHEYEGLVAYYPFTNDGKDYSGSGNNGSLEGNAYVNNNGELVLDGDDYVKVFDKGDFVFGVSDSYTSVYWVKANFEEQLTSYTRVLMEASAFYTYRHPGSSDISLSAWNSSSATGNHFVLQEVFDGDWHQIVLVMDRENQKAKAYKDGEQIGGAQSVEVDWFPTSYSNSPNNHMYIGIHSSISYGLKGSIDNVMVFNRALTSEEINEIYEIQKKE